MRFVLRQAITWPALEMNKYGPFPTPGRSVILGDTGAPVERVFWQNMEVPTSDGTDHWEVGIVGVIGNAKGINEALAAPEVKRAISHVLASLEDRVDFHRWELFHVQPPHEGFLGEGAAPPIGRQVMGRIINFRPHTPGFIPPDSLWCDVFCGGQLLGQSRLSRQALPPALPDNDAITWYVTGLQSQVIEDEYLYYWMGIESLATTIYEGPTCEKCGHIFQTCPNCLEPILPGERVMKALRVLLSPLGLSNKEIGVLYRRRSKLVHGGAFVGVEAQEVLTVRAALYCLIYGDRAMEVPCVGRAGDLQPHTLASLFQSLISQPYSYQGQHYLITEAIGTPDINTAMVPSEELIKKGYWTVGTRRESGAKLMSLGDRPWASTQQG